MKKVVIFMGFAKSGTTLIDSVLRESEEFLLPTRIKETKFFMPTKFTGKLDDYLNLYSITSNSLKKENRVLLECCPPYLHIELDRLESIVSNINKMGLDFRFVVNIRNPVYRSFSHYIHNINTHFAHNGFTYKRVDSFLDHKLYKYSFWESLQKEKEIQRPSYSDKLKYLISQFGAEKVLLFFLEKDTKNFDVFYKNLCSFCDVNYKPYFKDKELPRINQKQPLPRYYYADSKDLILNADGKFFKIDQGSLLVSHGKRSRIIRNLTVKRAYEIALHSCYWTDSINQEESRQIYDIYFRQDMDQFIKLVSNSYANSYDLSIYKNPVFKDYSIEFSAPSQQFLKANCELIS
ncbi:MAG: hypothetical protein KFF72_03970 [Arthrospira sp. SH-MAG29]|nr:hypothetical protein [Arthrospira sp. SH-MAG29]MBS0015515.1 hypothetical protein [Arthrospira sp. SH-MAG29]